MLGTRFVVERGERGVAVYVESEQVRVGGDAATERAPTSARTAAPSSPPAPTRAEAEPESTGGRAPSKRTAAAWRASAARGNYAEAYGHLRAGGPRAVRDVPEELMLAADVARWSGHSQAAVPYLQRVLREHRGDPRVQLAVFTLGRVYLEELGQPHGPLAADALAREIEAWSRAGEKAAALGKAEEYLRLYPEGAHLTAVRRFGGLE